jgi:hypothetical protein
VPLTHKFAKQSRVPIHSIGPKTHVLGHFVPFHYCTKVDAKTDEDIPPNDTPMPTTQQGPMTRARARELNYQVNSFLVFHKPSSMNGVLLNSCDAFLILRNMGHEPDWRESKHDKKASVDDQIGPYQFGPPGRGNFGRP